MSEDYYEILGLTRDSSSEDVKAAYRRLAKVWHPDRNKKRFAGQRFIEITEAYKVLENPQHRSNYDQLLRQHEATAADIESTADEFESPPPPPPVAPTPPTQSALPRKVFRNSLLAAATGGVSFAGLIAIIKWLLGLKSEGEELIILWYLREIGIITAFLGVIATISGVIIISIVHARR